MRWIVFVVSSVFLVGPCGAEIITVDDDGAADFSSIQEAVDYSWHGDTIIVSPGFYREDIFFNSRAITLTSTDPNDAEVVAGTVINGTVTFDFLEGPDTVLRGFTITGSPQGFAVCTDSANQSSPSVSGDIVIWQDRRNGNCDIYGYDLSTGREFPICTNSADQSEPSVSGDIVVWYDNRNGNDDIYGYDLGTGEEFAVCTDSADQSSPSVSGDIVVWQDYRNGNRDIYGYDLSTGEEFAVCTERAHQSSPSVSGDIVVWRDHRNGNDDIYGYDLSTGSEFPVCINSAYQRSPSVSGDIVVWQDDRSGNDGIYGYDVGTGTEFAVCTDSAYQGGPSVSGDIVVWRDHRIGNADIYGAMGVNVATTAVEVENGIVCYFSEPAVTNNVIANCTGAGVFCDFGSRPAVVYNRIESCGDGIKGSGGMIRGNTIIYNIRGVVNCAGAIEDNAIRANSGNGVQGCGGGISGNIIEGNDSGIYQCSGNITGNTIEGNRSNGIYQCGGTISGNVVNSNNGKGLYGCDGEVTGNSVSGNSGGGIYDCNGSVSENRVTVNSVYGVSDCDGTVSGNIVSANYGYGLVNCNSTVKNNVITANESGGVYSCNGSVVNNTIVQNTGNGIGNCSGVVKNNIIAYNGGRGIYGPGNNSYNCLWLNAAGSFYDNYPKTGDMYNEPLFAEMGRWDDNGTADIDGDDLWVGGDYHLKSAAGRWVEATAMWVDDSETSPCIDAGDAGDATVYERNPNGDIINMGAYGGTAEASKSLGGNGEEPEPKCTDRPSMDYNNDCKVDLADFAEFLSEWLDCGLDIQEACWQ